MRSPLSSFLFSFLQPRGKTAVTACHPGNPTWSPEQHLSNCPHSLSSCPTTTAFVAMQSELRRLLSPGSCNKSVHHGILPEGSRFCFVELTLAPVCVTDVVMPKSRGQTYLISQGAFDKKNKNKGKKKQRHKGQCLHVCKSLACLYGYCAMALMSFQVTKRN